MHKYSLIYYQGCHLYYQQKLICKNDKVKRENGVKRFLKNFLKTEKFGEIKIHIEHNIFKNYLGVDDKGMLTKMNEEVKLVNYLNDF